MKIQFLIFHENCNNTLYIQRENSIFWFQIAKMQYEDSESEESSEGEEGVDKEDPLWSLFSYIRYYKTNSGNALAEPFLTLPSKRELPDYYLTIANPISLNNIRKKLKNNEYADSSNLYEDLNLMFENCKTYNRPDSRLYKVNWIEFIWIEFFDNIVFCT